MRTSFTTRGLSMTIGTFLAVGALAGPAVAGTSPGTERQGEQVIRCSGGVIHNQFNPGLKAYGDQFIRDSVQNHAVGCEVLVDGLGPGFEKGKVLTMDATYVAEGRGSCLPALGMHDILNTPAQMTWSNGQRSVAGTNPYKVDIFKSSHVTGTITDGALAGADWELESLTPTASAFAEGVLLCPTLGFKNVDLETTMLNFYLDRSRFPAVPIPQPGRPASGDGYSPGGMVYVPVGTPYTMRVTLRNTGEVPLSSITVTDGTESPNTRMTNINCQAGQLAVRATTDCTGVITFNSGVSVNQSTFNISAMTPKGTKIAIKRDFYTYSR